MEYRSSKSQHHKKLGTLEQIPVMSRKNRFSDQYGLNDKFVVLYSGTLGKKQDIKLIADTVVKLAYDNEIIFVIATDARGQKLIKQQLAEKNLPNLLKLPLQSLTNYPYLLASSDVALVTLDATAGMYCVPSKLWSIYCAQKPSIVAWINVIYVHESPKISKLGSSFPLARLMNVSRL